MQLVKMGDGREGEAETPHAPAKVPGPGPQQETWGVLSEEEEDGVSRSVGSFEALIGELGPDTLLLGCVTSSLFEECSLNDAL